MSAGRSPGGEVRIIGTMTGQGEFVETILGKIFAKVFEIEEEEITDDSSPETVVLWDSLHHLKMITEIETAFRIKLAMKEIRSMVTFARIREVVGKHVTGDSAHAPLEDGRSIS